MKKLLFLAITIFFAVSVSYAQEGTAPSAPAKSTKAKPAVLKECVKVIKGKVYDVRDGKNVLVTTSVNINGTQIFADGTMQFKDGHTDVLKEGDCVLTDGSVLRDSSGTFREP